MGAGRGANPPASDLSGDLGSGPSSPRFGLRSGEHVEHVEYLEYVGYRAEYPGTDG